MQLPNNTTLQGGKYKIVHFIGTGGFGCTYEARHTLLDSRIALKEFFVSDFCNRDGRTGLVTVATQSKVELVDKLKKKFVEEARALFQMKHPGIVRVIDVFEENGTAYYAMEYIEGPSLSDLVKQRGHLPETEAVGYIRQVAEALKYVHSLNRLHLDIKPGNIMLNTEGKAVLIDFGASKHYDDETGENTSTLLGVNTKGYAPVEQVNQSFISFSPATDIYALGATLYKLLTGITPPPSTALHAEETTLSPLPSYISAQTRRSVTAAMQLLRKNRPQTVEAWLRMLSQDTADTEQATQSEDVEATVIQAETRQQQITEPTSNTPRNTIKWLMGYCIVVVAIIVLVVLQLGGNTVTHNGETSAGNNTNWNNTTGTITGTINGHDYVDLGLSVKWATCNVGATSPSDYGSYFAWGETSAKSEYAEANSKTYKKSMRDIAGNPKYDAARANWGSTWRLPTKAECEELQNKCTWTWTTQNSHKGYIVTSKTNGNSIFLPAAGCRDGTSLNHAGMGGFFWSSSPYESDTKSAYGLYFSSFFHGVFWNDRYYGRSVRPVSE